MCAASHTAISARLSKVKMQFRIVSPFRRNSFTFAQILSDSLALSVLKWHFCIQTSLMLAKNAQELQKYSFFFSLQKCFLGILPAHTHKFMAKRHRCYLLLSAFRPNFFFAHLTEFYFIDENWIISWMVRNESRLELKRKEKITKQASHQTINIIIFRFRYASYLLAVMKQLCLIYCLVGPKHSTATNFRAL